MAHRYAPVDNAQRGRDFLTPRAFIRASRDVKQGMTPYLGIWLRSVVSVAAVTPTYAGRIRQDPKMLNFGHPTLGPLDTPPELGNFNGLSPKKNRNTICSAWSQSCW